MKNIADSKWLIVQDIPINRGQSVIKSGGVVTVSNHVIYLDGGMLDLGYQEDFANLIISDKKHEYVRPYNDITGKSIIGDIKEN